MLSVVLMQFDGNGIESLTVCWPFTAFVFYVFFKTNEIKKKEEFEGRDLDGMVFFLLFHLFER